MREISFEFDPFDLVGLEAPAEGADEARKKMADFLLEKVLSYVGDGKSPVAGGEWKRTLSPEYKKVKSKVSSKLFANMELYGDMLDALEVADLGSDLSLRIVGPEADKADGHNNHSGKSKLPLREFIPKDGGTFKRDIIAGMRDIALDFLKEAENVSGK